ncbi:MAG: response regulator [Candidatus Methylophosphatis roskildensis]|uniref:Response regulator transcription factor n=1 Tax=Candidatus Methylophosphatis roskildensis TaxID=2899263 RepID=A0A9D7E6A4_9PROT|nr:response regulator transcription factor [Candidatus Methylophosphatis roskildensis]MBK7236138.1 response regulator transcription factor [Sterolibacteriaceae bacterium]
MNAATVFIVDDDAAVRDGLSMLCESAGLRAECFDCAEAFLATYRPQRPGCLVLDVRMPRISGPQLHEELARHGDPPPIIYLTAHGDIPTTVQAIKAGAQDFLTKPVDGALLIERIQAALARDLATRQRSAALADQCARLVDLTEREREIMTLAVAGESNKVIAKHLGISHRTVEIHRTHILRKTGASNVLELAKLAAECGLTIAKDLNAEP